MIKNFPSECRNAFVWYASYPTLSIILYICNDIGDKSYFSGCFGVWCTVFAWFAPCCLYAWALNIPEEIDFSVMSFNICNLYNFVAKYFFMGQWIRTLPVTLATEVWQMRNRVDPKLVFIVSLFNSIKANSTFGSGSRVLTKLN